ncbi:dihydrodipicolinate synthase family protein [Actinopolymorpha alba]|uniref:dihydrodipicolinate synthase family protein n=1 Tax=Actinopolymorpha alba TaxID=533267 RepID=UPI00035D7C9F|nr:dihydrodipicolinate synthase family protein [Actinopolymorpha alba]
MPSAPSTSVHIITAVPTPFTDAGQVDDAGARALARALPETIHAAFVAGTTGEFPALSDDERIGLIELMLAELGPERVIAHVGAPSARQAASLAARAVRAGAVRLAAITPYFLPAPEEGVRDYYRAIIDAGGVDTFAYLFPERTGLEVTPAQLASLAELPALTGAKLSGAAAAAFAEFAAAVPASFTMYSGNDDQLPEVVAAGGSGVVSGVSAAFPEPFLEQADALRRGDPAAVDRVRPTIARLVPLVGPSIPALKLAVRHRLGLGAATRMALATPDAGEVALIEEAAAEFGPL